MTHHSGSSANEQVHTTRLAGLLVDYGGVLTSPVVDAWRAFCVEEGISLRAVVAAVLDAYEDTAVDSPVVALETGSVPLHVAEERLAALLAAATGQGMNAKGLVNRMMRQLRANDAMWRAVEIARAAGIRTGLLSNSWGSDGYPRERLRRAFDTVVISAEVGMRKPSAEIFHLGARRLGLQEQQCVFVDDLEANVIAARSCGLVGVLHRNNPDTLAQLETLLGVSLPELL